jgi:CubicO group peptidase (beta-lactamase class C family)
MQRFSFFLVSGALAVCARAQQVTLEDSPNELARTALGGQRGYAAAGIWHNGQAATGSAHSPDMGGLKPPPDLYEIGSITKVFTGLLLAQEVEAGRLSLDDTLGKLLANRVVLKPEVAAITLRQLVTHSSCLPRLSPDFELGKRDKADDPYADYDRTRLWMSLRQVTLPHAPPCRGDYSNYGMAVLGEVLAQQAGKTWETLVAERITGPLGMRDTVQHLGARKQRLAPGYIGNDSARPWEFQAYAPAGALRSSAADMLVFGRALMAGEKGPLGKAGARALEPLGKVGGDTVGYAIMMRGPAGHRFYHHNGATGAYKAMLAFTPDTQDVLVLLAGNARSSTEQIAFDAWAARFRVADTRIDVDPARLPDYAGVFRTDDKRAFTFVAQDGRLYERLTAQPFSALVATAPDVFALPAYGAEFHFARTDGRITGVTLHQRGAELAATRSAEPAPARAVLPEVTQAAYGGDYAADDPKSDPPGFKVVAQDGQISIQPVGEPMLPVFPVAGKPDRFASDVVEAEFTFERDVGGRVNALVMYQGPVVLRTVRK